MGINPDHTPRPATPPRDTGWPLAVFERGPTEELRATLAEYRGHPYLALRVWALAPDGRGWWPVRGKGVSVRLGEVAGLRDVLADLASRIAPGGDEDGPDA